MRALLILLVVALLAIGASAVQIEEDNNEVQPSFLMVDVTHDGEADIKLSASNDQGLYDTIEHIDPVVTNQKAKTKLLDVDGDGQPDLRLTDSNKDGLYDQVSYIEQSPTPTVEVVPINPLDPIPTDAPVLKQPIIFPAPSATKKNRRGISFGAPPANLTKPVIVDNTIPLPPLPKRHRCGCRNSTKRKSYRNDVQYRLKKKAGPKRHRCGCGRKNKTAKVLLPPIVAKLYPERKNRTRKHKHNSTRPCGKIHKKKVQKLAPQYRSRRKEKQQRRLQPGCAKNRTAPRNHTVRPNFYPLTRAQRKLKNVTFAQ